jgi:hypothetical protein
MMVRGVGLDSCPVRNGSRPRPKQVLSAATAALLVGGLIYKRHREESSPHSEESDRRFEFSRLLRTKILPRDE